MVGKMIKKRTILEIIILKDNVTMIFITVLVITTMKTLIKKRLEEVLMMRSMILTLPPGVKTNKRAIMQ